MTSANVFNWTAVKSSQTLNANARASGSKAGSEKTASVFASMMSANYSAGANVAKNAASTPSSWGKPAEESKQVCAYDRYQYRDHSIDTAETTAFADKIAASAEELAGFEGEVTEIVADKLGLTEDQVVQAMEAFGFTAFDLLDPQKLIQLTVELTGAKDQTELLVSPQFLDLMQAMQAAGEELMAELELPMDQMDALIAQMDVLETPVQMPEGITQTENTPAENTPAVELPETDLEENAVPVVRTETAETEESQSQTVSVEKTNTEGKEAVFAAEEEPDEPLEPDDVLTKPEKTGNAASELPKKDLGQSGEQSSFGNREESAARAARPQTVVSDQMPNVQNVFQNLESQAVSELTRMDSAYLSVDTMDIIEQVAQQLKVTVSEGLSSMEMTLNPENLGKVYIQISAREGAVHAQIAAANEAVKNALESQVAVIQENLNQAGVKVEAIEVTVAAHEFERNLEQNQKREEKEGEQAQESVKRRRNLNLSSLDDLSSIMSEEEALVAQIMKENGNSVDLSA